MQGFLVRNESGDFIFDIVVVSRDTASRDGVIVRKFVMALPPKTTFSSIAQANARIATMGKLCEKGVSIRIIPRIAKEKMTINERRKYQNNRKPNGRIRLTESRR
jgi:hypothetical protein